MVRLAAPLLWPATGLPPAECCLGDMSACGIPPLPIVNRSLAPAMNLDPHREAGGGPPDQQR